MTKNGTRIKAIVMWEKSRGRDGLGKGKSTSFCLIEKKERERERERGRNSSYFCECMTENLKYIESQDFA